MDTATPDGRTRVFLSYSRKDSDFVHWLAAELTGRGCVADFDQSTADPSNVDTGISAEDAWWARLEEMITLADVVVFVVSPDSARSPICDEEIAFAQNLGKRIIPVLCRPIDFATAPPRLSALNIKISFVDSDNTADHLARLHSAIQLDVTWLRTGARLLSAARRWDASGRLDDGLPRGSEQSDAEDWAARRPTSAPEHSDLVLDFLAAGRSAEARRRTIGEIEKARYLELVGLMRVFLEEELKVRESIPLSDHYGVALEQQTEIALLRGLLHLENTWHPEPAVHVESTGAVQGYSLVFQFPCCGRTVRDFHTGRDDSPSQFRPGGCTPVPDEIQYEYQAPVNPFHSALIARYREATRQNPGCSWR
ncbi:toll/interleukin-1 receptor domain-containing protein [Streptoalloteichus hindustanus]|uniref:TIR domain-containing protein n=1 Tax=Streptoalloteichus hindustanus TaxID=2017 RepID=A0A1M5D454_STRHI|nr:toll/interleukin-1 receptor domain-containing protein [Streptoalloteichus hindustanus]SHF61766.1 TIR domain-containing protein [Streptoalloteichus hindustanus]